MVVTPMTSFVPKPPVLKKTLAITCLYIFRIPCLSELQQIMGVMLEFRSIVIGAALALTWQTRWRGMVWLSEVVAKKLLPLDKYRN
jgi:hypothetical protein